MKIPPFVCVLAAIVLCLSGMVAALTCITDNAPYVRLTSPPAALCHINDTANDECFTFLSDPANSTEQWGVMPDKPISVAGIGAAQYFTVMNGAVNVVFSIDRLHSGLNVTGNVRCGDEAYIFNFTPQYIDYSNVPQFFITVRQNVAFGLLSIIIITVLVMLGIIIYKYAIR